ncbi:MAG TPA: hypothetical protein VE861_04445 [Gemmatimonadaceae bacterium]|nr:hypothetical protein [Gemmatimonadaceae bacterium]
MSSSSYQTGTAAVVHASLVAAPSRRVAVDMPLPAGPITLPLAALLDDKDGTLLDTLMHFAARIGVALQAASIPASLARSGTVGRIGVPRESIALMLEKGMLLGSTIGSDALEPVPRLWRGLQRRAGVFVDLQRCGTAERAEMRDVLLLSQRVPEWPGLRRSAGEGDTVAAQWLRARQAAEVAYQRAVAEDRRVLLVTPIGRSTDAHRYLRDAMDRQARLHRLPAPRSVKAALLSSLIGAHDGDVRWLVASVTPIHELRTMMSEVLDDITPWPVLSIGTDVTCCDLRHRDTATRDPMSLLLALVTLLEEGGHRTHAATLLDAILLTDAASRRMREELGGTLDVPSNEFLDGVVANFGRMRIV